MHSVLYTVHSVLYSQLVNMKSMLRMPSTIQPNFQVAQNGGFLMNPVYHGGCTMVATRVKF